MPRHSAINNVSIKFECPSQLKVDFAECCKDYDMSSALALRLVMQEWIDLWRAKKEKAAKR